MRKPWRWSPASCKDPPRSLKKAYGLVITGSRTAQWNCVESLIDEKRLESRWGRRPCRIPPRTMLELFLLKLRTRCAWRKVPIDGFTYNEFFFHGTQNRLHRHLGSCREGLERTIPGVAGWHQYRSDASLRSSKISVDENRNITKVPEESLAQRVWDPRHEYDKISADKWIDLTDQEWSVVSEVLPPSISRRKHRKFVTGILFVAATRTAWQKLPARYGSWSSLYKFLKKVTEA